MSPWTCDDCTRLPIASKIEHCPVCHQTFAGSTIGDAHRVSDPSARHGRRCLTVAEMAAKGWVIRERKNGLSVWGHPSPDVPLSWGSAS